MNVPVCALVTIMLAYSASALAASPPVDGFKKLAGSQIGTAFVGKTFSDDTHFANRYKGTGRLKA